ncbi:MAG TPA: hypothetical protein V6D19_14070, partial [Stenomitos sp.]
MRDATNALCSLCSLALILWGYQTGAWNFAIPMVVALEARSFLKRRWTISAEYFKALHVFAALVWLAAIFNVPAIDPSTLPYAATYHLLKTLPVGFYLLVLHQTYCTNFTAL